MRQAAFTVVLLLAASANAQISDFDPDELCVLLNDFGIETTPFGIVSGDRPLCYSVAHPGSAEEGTDYSFRVLGADDLNPAGLSVVARGGLDSLVDGPAYGLYLQMVERLLARFFDPIEVADVLGIYRQMGPNERSSATGKGIEVQFYRIHRPLPGIGTLVELSFGLADACAYVRIEAAHEQCLSDSIDFAWEYQRKLMQ